MAVCHDDNHGDDGYGLCMPDEAVVEYAVHPEDEEAEYAVHLEDERYKHLVGKKEELRTNLLGTWFTDGCFKFL